MTSCPSKRNVTRQFPDTLTDHSPFRFPFSGCKSYPGRSIAAGFLATFSSVKISRSLATCCAWTPFRSSFSKRRFNPLCVNLRITLLTVTCNVSGVNGMIFSGATASRNQCAVTAPRHHPPALSRGRPDMRPWCSSSRPRRRRHGSPRTKGSDETAQNLVPSGAVCDADWCRSSPLRATQNQ